MFPALTWRQLVLQRDHVELLKLILARLRRHDMNISIESTRRGSSSPDKALLDRRRRLVVHADESSQLTDDEAFNAIYAHFLDLCKFTVCFSLKNVDNTWGWL